MENRSNSNKVHFNSHIGEKKRNELQKVALETSLKYKRCGLGITMGIGKTRIAINHILKNSDPLFSYLVVVPKNTVIAMWKDELRKINIHKGIKSRIEYVNYRSLNKCSPDKYDIVYLDECHNLLQSHNLFLEAYKGKILGLTGTPPNKRSFEKYNMVKQYCPIVFEYSIDQATDNRILNDYKIVVHELCLSNQKEIHRKTKQGLVYSTSEQKDYEYLTHRVNSAVTSKEKQFSAIMRMRGLMNYKTKESYLKSLLLTIDQKCIVFANTKKQADRICHHSYYSGNPSSEENLSAFMEGRLRKLSCVLQLSEGISIPNLSEAIIMHAYGNNRKTAQRIGRLLRLSSDQKAICHILCFKNTIDEIWIKQALEEFDKNKIVYSKPK